MAGGFQSSACSQLPAVCKGFRVGCLMDTFLSITKVRLVLVVSLACLLGSGGCTQEIEPWNGPVLTEPRNQLTVAQLVDGDLQDLLDMSFFSRPAWATDASNEFSGELSFDDTTMTYPLERSYYAGENTFPAFRTRFVTYRGRLIPVEPRLLRTGEGSASMWDVQVGTGRVWSEGEDGEWSRASFPLSLTDRFIGQVRNCVATFIYKPDVVSHVYVQCSQETADANDGRIGDIRVMLDVEHRTVETIDTQAVIDSYEQSTQASLPVRPLGTMDSGGELGAYFERSLLTNASTSQGALLVGDTLYVHPPRTRHGLYPYPGAMRHGMYSVTKSMAGALALFYVAERYGREVLDIHITDYVPALSEHSGWQDVTFLDALNMVTGTEGGESGEQLRDVLIIANSAEEAIANVANLGDAPPAPGERFNYASTNLFVLSYALQRYVSAVEGEPVNYWDMVRNDVLVPIGAGNLRVLHTQESDESKRIPFLAYGATPTVDEAAKIALLFSNDGAFEGRQLLHRESVREALGRTVWTGIDTGGDPRGQRYRHGFWATSLRTSGCELSVSYMLRHGGNYVVFLPDGSVILRFMDELDYDPGELVRHVVPAVVPCP